MVERLLGPTTASGAGEGIAHTRSGAGRRDEDMAYTPVAEKSYSSRPTRMPDKGERALTLTGDRGRVVMKRNRDGGVQLIRLARPNTWEINPKLLVRHASPTFTSPPAHYQRTGPSERRRMFHGVDSCYLNNRCRYEMADEAEDHPARLGAAIGGLKEKTLASPSAAGIKHVTCKAEYQKDMRRFPRRK